MLDQARKQKQKNLEQNGERKGKMTTQMKRIQLMVKLKIVILKKVNMPRKAKQVTWLMWRITFN